jgi:hypothetical protein
MDKIVSRAPETEPRKKARLIDKIASRAFPAFAVGFSVFFAPAYAFTSGDATFSWPLFTYFPAAGDYGELHPFLVPGSDTLGPPMWWYGWMASAIIVGLIFAALSLLLPEKSTLKIWSVAVWVAPLVAFVFLLDYSLFWFVPGWQPVTSFMNPNP